jgi:putative ABC transport system permease protein
MIFGAGTEPGNHRIIGVIKDFHFESLHKKITPIVLFPQATAAYLLMRVSPANLPQTLADIKTVWDRLAAEQTFAYSFLDDDFDNVYRAEERWSALISSGAMLALLTACLGLFGLASLLVKQKTREVGIRKVLGASVANLIGLLSRDFAGLVLVANLLAWPIAWYAMHRWLQNFAYRTAIDWSVFAITGGLALLIAFLTVCTQALKAALANPVEALRYE